MNKLDSNIVSFKPEDLRLPLPNDAFREIIKYLDPQSIQAALQVNTYFAKKTLKVTRVKQNSLTEDFAKFLLGKLNPNLYQDQINALLPFCETKKFLFLSNLIEIKSVLSETKNVMINILKSLNLEDLIELKKLHLSKSKPDFFEDIFDIAIDDVSKIYQELNAALAIQNQDEREDALQKVCEAFIKVNNFNNAMELAHKIMDVDKKGPIFSEVFQLFIKHGKLEKCLNIFDAIDDDQYLKIGLFYEICKSLAKNSYFEELTDFINKIEIIGRGLEGGFLISIKLAVIFDVYEILIPLQQNSDNKIAIKLAYSLEDRIMKIQAFDLLCRALVKEDKLDQALAICDTLTPILIPRWIPGTPGLIRGSKNRFLSSICESLVEIGNADKALEIIADRIHEEQVKSRCFASISIFLAEEGNRAKALEIAHSINIQELREQTLQQIHSIPLNEDLP